MKEDIFYEICDLFDENDQNITDSWYPTVEELKSRTKNKAKFYPLFIYFASDPLSKINSGASNEPEYLETVRYSKSVVEQIELV